MAYLWHIYLKLQVKIRMNFFLAILSSRKNNWLPQKSCCILYSLHIQTVVFFFRKNIKYRHFVNDCILDK